MRIDTIVITNFRQYFGTNKIDLNTDGHKNIVVIGGKNGYGKTNFLLSLVWCLYGDDIAKIDESFKREIQKDGNYSKFLRGSLNWDAQRSGGTKFCVEIHFSGIELPDMFDSKSGNTYSCILKRAFDVNEAADDLEIAIDGVDRTVFKVLDDKINFINDYLIPLAAAKFVFFDAEKIASWAELSTKEEGNILNDALSKILGLDVYEGLIFELKIYTDTLRKDSASDQVRQQIISTEKGIELDLEKIEDYEQRVLNIDAEIQRIKGEVSAYDAFLITHSNTALNSESLEEMYKQRSALKQKEKELEAKFNELSEMIPFAIAAGKLEETVEHMKKQEDRSALDEKRAELMAKTNELVEKLFNAAPFPNDGDISFSKKMFYADKAKRILELLFGNTGDPNDIEFDHDLSNSEKELILDTYRYIQKQSKDLFEQTIDGFERIKNDILDVERVIKKFEGDMEDEEVIEYSTKKNDAERKIEKLIEERGSCLTEKDNLKRNIDKLSQSRQIFLKRISVSQQKRKKLDLANLYTNALEDFVTEQKRNKCRALEISVFEEMKKLMHKLNEKNYEHFIAAVKAETLPNNDGLKITLFNNDGGIRAKESLSQGEKQIYISSLVKAILALSIQEFPIFIDTPLGRLDDDHIKQVLLHYYPDLAGQVILMATNNEIPPSRFKLMQDNVAQSYLLDYNNNKTRFKEGYFKSHEN